MVTATAVMGKTSETLGDLLTGFAADLDDATLQAQFADPLADPAAILGNATSRYPLRPRRLPADPRRGAALAARRRTPWPARPTSPT